MPVNAFVGAVAELYDDVELLNSTPATVGPAVRKLCALNDAAGGGPVLEFAIGTGRIALPLRERGVEVHGIELSQDMVTQMRRKPGGDDVPVVIGDMATARVPGAGSFSLVYLVYNTISNLLDQSEQVECFANAAAHLRPGGLFVIELFIPQIRRTPPGVTSAAFDVSEEHVGFDVFDFANQRLTSQHYWPRARQDRAGAAMASHASQHRYAWPAELDLMARLAGMVPYARWEDWSDAPFTGESTQHVSVWQLPPSP
jgi:SAM-dependent methyltransferase